VLTVLLIGELCHSRRERAWLRQVRASYGALFPPCPPTVSSPAVPRGCGNCCAACAAPSSLLQSRPGAGSHGHRSLRGLNPQNSLRQGSMDHRRFSRSAGENCRCWPSMSA
jgi:hypothetical protein